MPASDADSILLEKIRRGDEAAWRETIARFEGRLIAFAESRLRDRAAAEDVVQETFVGFLTSLPNFDAKRSLESWLFAICAHKLTDLLRKSGRRPTLPLLSERNRGYTQEPAARGRMVSSAMRSAERVQLEEGGLAKAIGDVIGLWRSRGRRDVLRAVELVFLRGVTNRRAAEMLRIDEQRVANAKHEFLEKLGGELRKQGLPGDVFPELAAR